MGRLGIRIINIVLFSASCFFSAAVFNHVAESQLAPDYVSAFQPVAQTEAKQPSWDERNEILERNLFGAKVAVTEQPRDTLPSPPPEDEAQSTKLPLKLLGTMAGEPASLSTAVIENTREKKHQVVRVGDTLKAFEGVTVTSIEPRRVLLRNHDITEELLLAKAEPTVSANVRSSRRLGRDSLQRRKDRRARASRNRSRTSRSARPEPNLPVEDASDTAIQAQLEKLQSALTQDLIRDLEPAYDDAGKISGVLVGNISGDGLLARSGLEQDDVIVSLNGIAINSAGAAARVLRELSKCIPMTGSVRGASGSRRFEITDHCSLK